MAFSLLSPPPAKAESEASAWAEDAINRGQLLESKNPLALATVGLAMLFQDGDKIGMGICTGTLIDRDIVLTAAHCLKNQNHTLIKVGAVLNTPSGRKPRNVESYVIHPLFTGRQMRTLKSLFLQSELVVLNDIALVKLSEPADSSSLIAALPTRNLPEDLVYGLTPVGYGKPDGTQQSKAGTLRIGKSRGRMAQASNGSLQFLRLESGAMTCQGDSGGPIFLSSAKHPTVVGITSHGDRNCEVMSMATAVGYYLDWIRNTREQLR